MRAGTSPASAGRRGAASPHSMPPPPPPPPGNRMPAPVVEAPTCLCGRGGHGNTDLHAPAGTAATSNTTTQDNGNSGDGVRALAVSGTTVYAGGDFIDIGGQPRSGIAALDATTAAATAWNPHVGLIYGGVGGNGVRAMAVSGTKVYAGGDFTSIGGQARNGIAALDATTGTATSWDPNVQDLGVIGDGVRAVVVSGTTVYAGGEFIGIGGQQRNDVAALDSTTG